MKKFWGEKINFLLIIHTNNQADKRRGQVLGIFLLVLCVLLFLLTIQNGIEFSIHRTVLYKSYVLQNIVVLSFITILFLLNRQGKTTLAAYISLFLVIASTLTTIVPVAPTYALLFLAMPVLLSSFVLKPESSFIFAIVTFILYSYVFTLFRPIFDYGLIPALTLFAIAVISWNTASQLEHAHATSRESEKKYRNLFDNVPVGLYRTTPDGKILDANPALVKMFGFTDQVSLLKTNAKEFYSDPSMRDQWLEKLSQSPNSGQFSMVFELKRQDGTSFWALNSTQVVYDENDNLLYYEGSIFDITKRKKTEERISNQLARLAALRAIDSAITGSDNLELILRTILDQVKARLNVDAAAILLSDPQTNSLRFHAGVGFRTKSIEKSNISLAQDSHTARVFRGYKIIAIHDLAKEEHYFKRTALVEEEGFSSYFGVPLLAKKQVKGILEVFQRGQEERDREWFEFLEALAKQAAIAIDNATLLHDLQISNNELREAYETTIEGWSRALDLRDKETEGHTQRVTELTLRIARVMGFSGEELLNIRRGALLHDIGKMGVPDHILLKPGPLTDDEPEIIKKHPRFAYELLSPIEYLRDALDIPYYHHEKWDGTGYPLGLKGKEIPLPARIFSIVDVYDALTSERPYRKAWSKEKTLKHIRELEGTHFDPLVAEIFFDVMKDE